MFISLQVSRCGTRRLMWLLTSSSQEASSQSSGSSSPQSSRQLSPAASLPSKATQLPLLVHVCHCTLMLHTSKTLIEHALIVVLFSSMHSHCFMSVVHTQKNMFPSLSFSPTQTHCRESSRHTRAVSPFYVAPIWFLCFPCHLSQSFSSRLQCPLSTLPLSKQLLWQGLVLSWTRSHK